MFEMPPFLDCPECDGKDSLGVLMVCDRHYVRRCKKCKYTSQHRLPELSKRFLLLDQFVFSNIAKAIDPKFNKSRMTELDYKFYRKLFAKLERLFRYQLIICPNTQIHRNESIISEDYEKFKIVWKHLSSDIELIGPDIVYCRQVWDSFNRWESGGDKKAYKNDPSEIYDRTFNVWMDPIRISLDLPKDPGLVNELQHNREKRKEWLDSVFKQWKTDKSLTFKDWYNEEIAGSIKVLEDQLKRQIQIYLELAKDPNSHNSFELIGNGKANLLLRMLNLLRETETDEEVVYSRLREFFGSDYYRDLPVVRIESALWAGLAHQICHGGMSFPNESIFNDFRSISAYLPFIDLIIVDRQCYNILSQNPVRDFLSIPTKVFSLGQKDEILEYLDQIESDASTEIKDQVHTLYGEHWLKPYFSIIEDQFYKRKT